MARVLQIRRGTTAQNDNFTGLAGEITFDTDAKTIRVHDGETLGGFALAKENQQQGNPGETGGQDFDINSVPDEFWQNLFNRFGLQACNTLTSSLINISNAASIEYIFNTEKTAKITQVFLVCQTPEAGYSIGDEVAAFGIENRTNPAPNAFVDTLGLHVKLMVNEQSFWVSHKSTGATTNITPENWRILFRVYC